MLILFTVLMTTATFASDRNDAYNMVCKGMFSESSKTSCMQTVKKFSFFNIDGLNICASLFNDTSKVDCLASIGDKNFESFEITQCGSVFSDSSKIECFKSNGTMRAKLPACIKKEDLVNILSWSLNDLHSGNFSAVDFTLTNLLNSLSACE